MTEIEPPKENGEKEIGKKDKLHTTTFQIEIENRRVEGLITYSTDQQIFKFKVNSWGVNIEFTLYELKCTIDAILQHMGFYHTTENPCVMMRAKHNIKSCECIIIHQDELYIASSTIQEILHIMKEEYKIKIISNDYLESDFSYDAGGTMICYLKFQLDTQQSIHIYIINILNFINSRIIYNSRYTTKKEEKLTHEFILYTRDFLHENGKQILHNGEC